MSRAAFPSRRGEGRVFPDSDMRDLLARNYVAPHPLVARQRIRDTFSCELTVRGDDCSGIGILRQLIASLDSDARYAKALLISAPHTHWGDQTIVESFEAEQNAFVVGPHSGATNLKPYSFVFTLKGPVAYEWADDTVPVARSELAEIWNFIWRLNEMVIEEFTGRLPIPLGVTIDHRFKKSIWDEQIFSFAEIRSINGRAVVKARVESVIEANPVYPGQVQAAWFSSPAAEKAGVNDREASVLSRLENILRNQEPTEAVRFLEQLESYLRSQSKA
jgi:hypothetical protein